MTKSRSLANSVNPNSIPATRLEDETITSDKIGPSQVDSDEIALGAITANKIDSGAITDAKVAQDANISSQKLIFSPSVSEVERSVESKLEDFISIIDFGADPTGVLDSTAAIQSAINYAFLEKPNIEIIFPDGIYTISDSILAGDFDNSHRDANFYKCPSLVGIGNAIIAYKGPPNKAALRIGRPNQQYTLNGTRFENLRLSCGAEDPTGTVGLFAQGCHYGTFHGISSTGFDVAIHNGGSIGVTFDCWRRLVQGRSVSLKITDDPLHAIGIRANDTSYINILIRGTGSTVGIDAYRFGGSSWFDGLIIEGGLSLGFRFDLGGEVIIPGAISWDRTYMKNTWFEAIDGRIGELSRCHLEMHNCFIVGQGVAPILKKDSFSKLYFNGTANYNANFVEVTDPAHKVNIFFNDIPFGGLPYNGFPWNQTIQNNTPSELLYAQPQSYKLLYGTEYPSGNNNFNNGLALDMSETLSGMFGDWKLVRVTFVGGDAISSNVLEIIVTKFNAVIKVLEVSTNAPGGYTVAGDTISFNFASGGWYRMNALYTKEM